MEFATPLWNAGCPPFGSANIPGHFHDASTSTKTENGSTIREWEACPQLADGRIQLDNDRHDAFVHLGVFRRIYDRLGKFRRFHILSLFRLGLVAGKNDPRRRWRRWLTLHGPAEPLCLPPFPDRCHHC